MGITSDICFEFISKMDEYAVLASKWKIEAERLENEVCVNLVRWAEAY